MSTEYKTEQEKFWAGSFGQDYVGRNRDEELLNHKKFWLAQILQKAGGLSSAIEFGANIGLNGRALQSIFPQISLSAVEINPEAARQLAKMSNMEVFCQSVLEYPATKLHDLVLSMGFLIHVNPDHLPSVYEKMARSTRRYACIIEYYNPKPVSLDYRGEKDKLFKRDFAGEFMDQHPEFKLLDYGFIYRRDPQHPLDDLNWFLMQRAQ